VPVINLDSSSSLPVSILYRTGSIPAEPAFRLGTVIVASPENITEESIQALGHDGTIPVIFLFVCQGILRMALL
jgi:hypothetical protein